MGDAMSFETFLMAAGIFIGGFGWGWIARGSREETERAKRRFDAMRGHKEGW